MYLQRRGSRLTSAMLTTVHFPLDRARFGLLVTAHCSLLQEDDLRAYQNRLRVYLGQIYKRPLVKPWTAVNGSSPFS
jgi:hypothetical protein